MNCPTLDNPYVQFASDRSILITVGKGISRECHADVFRLFLLLTSKKNSCVQTIHPAYNSILVTFDPMNIVPEEMLAMVQSIVQQKDTVTLSEPRRVEIPVCYEEAFAPDLMDVAKHNELTIEEVIHIHSSPEYLVYFMGFSPGFPYLGEMPDEIATPRLQTPRLKVPAGSVAIGGRQTGIYPVASPGGWRLIGRTPLKLFSPEKNPPTLLQMGDQVRFVPITKNEFDKMHMDE